MVHRVLGPLPNVPNHLRIQVLGTINSTPWMIDFYAEFSGSSPDNAALRTFNQTMIGIMATNLCPLFTGQASIVGIKTTDLTQRTSAWDQFLETHPGTRPATGGSLANNVAQCISKVIQRRYRGGHPRFYLPPPGAVDVTGGKTWSGPYVQVVQAALPTFFAAFNNVNLGGTRIVMKNVGYYTHDSNGLPIYLPTPNKDVVTGLAFRTRVDSQRARLGKETS